MLRELAGQQCVMRWFGHVERMKEDQLVKKIMGSDIRSVRLRGRP